VPVFSSLRETRRQECVGPGCGDAYRQHSRAPTKKNEGSRLLSYAYTEAKGMDSFIDAAILATAVVGSFGAAFMIQTAALRLILRAMKYR
jgi:hypothetical protein